MKLVSCCLLVVLSFSAPMFAQMATLRGQVTDQSGALVPGARVTLNGPSGLVKTASAANDGSYSFGDLAPGAYTVQASAPDLTIPQPAKIVLKSGVQILNLQLSVSMPLQKVAVQENTGPTVSTEAANNASAIILRG